MSNREITMARSRVTDLFDPDLRAISLHLQLGGRETDPPAIAARILRTLDVLEELDPRPVEWLHSNASHDRSGVDDTLPRSLKELALSVADGARADDAGHFHPSFGYYVSLFGFLEGTMRRVCPFSVSVTDGCQDTHSSDSFILRLDEAEVTGRPAVTDGFCSLVEVWEPVRGAIGGHALAKLHRNDPVLYPPVGVLTYFAENSGYRLPESHLVDLRVLEHGTVAVLKDWTLKANLEYEKAFAAVNDGIPNRRLGN